MVRLLPYVLAGMGLGFLVANALVFVDFARYWRRRKNALLIWEALQPRWYVLMGLCLGLALALLIVVNVILVLRTPHSAQRVWAMFGEAMMFLYFAGAQPLSRRIGRGFYADGVWSERGFVPYHQIGGIAWREGEPVTLLLIERFKQLARPLLVPTKYYGAVRRLVRDRIGAHEIMFAGDALDLGGHDERDDV
jgi:hypothetical protein